ncbi:type II toxin-antitoxin system RelE/ParE family toxin [Gemmatimonadota bacterium]
MVELRADHAGDTYRLYYKLKCPGSVYVLFCHKKKSKHGRVVRKHERALILRRLRESMADCLGRQGGDG